MATSYTEPGGHRSPQPPVTLLESFSPYGSRKVTVEYDGLVTAAYLHDDASAISATWIANHRPAPSATDQARLAVDTRAFPLLIYDPRKGDTIRQRLSLQGNPAVNDDWWTNPKTGQLVDFIDFARSEGRFVKHFDKDGNPSKTLLHAKQDRLENWHLLQELAGLR